MGIFDQLFGKKKQKLTIEEEKAKETEEAKKMFHKGYLRVEMGLAEESIKYFDKALKIFPQCAVALNGKGMALRWIGKYEEAIRCFDEALELNPQFAWCWTQKGITLNDFGPNNEVIKCYDHALEIEPENDFVLVCKKRTLTKLGRFKQVKKRSSGLSSEEIMEIPEGTRIKLNDGNYVEITPGIRMIAKYEYHLTHLLGSVDKESERNFFKNLSDEELIKRATFFPSKTNNTIQQVKLEMAMRTFTKQSDVVKKYLRKSDENINRYNFQKMVNNHDSF